MFVEFFYSLRDSGVPVSPTTFLRLQKALAMGLVNSLDDFYVAARSIMVKSERHFDAYDLIFARHFRGADREVDFDKELEETMRLLLQEWLQDPKKLAEMLGIDPNSLPKMTPEELVKYFMEKLKEQTERHDGGNKWIGTGGTSPVGHSGYHPGGMRVGGSGGGKSAVKVALDRRYKDYTRDNRLTSAQVGEALRRLKNLQPTGPKDHVDVEDTISQTVKNAGEIEIVFDRSLRDRLKVVLMIDNGGWSMDPYVEVVQTLFNYAHASFKELKIFFFHNCIYDDIYEDPERHRKPHKTIDLSKLDPETRVIIVGDAAMAPSELEDPAGCIHWNVEQTKSAIDQIRFIMKAFKHSIWLNPMVEYGPNYIRGPYTTVRIARLMPMFPLSLDGLDRAVTHLKSKN